MKKQQAVCYLRMSTDKQDTSIQAQRDRIYPFFADKYEVVAEYIDEGKSGSKDTEKRINFLKMIADLTTGKYKGKIKVALCLDLSRFGRLDTITGAEHKIQLRNAGVTLDTVHDGPIDWNTSTGRIVDSVKSEGNHQLSIFIASKGLQGRIRVTKEGMPNQTTPFGMAKKVKPPTGEEIIIKRGTKFAKPKSWASEFIPGDPDEVAAVKFMFETFDREDITYRELARRLQEQGFPSPGGHSRSTKGKITGWRYDTIQWMLRNPVYAGDLRIGEIPKGKHYQIHQGQEKAVYTIDNDEESQAVISKDVHLGIIDRPLFDRVQTKYQRNLDKDRRPHRNRVGAYALSPGIIHCGKCGMPMYGQKADYGDRSRITYLCHGGQANMAVKCNSFTAYENEIMPLIVQNFFGELTKELDQQDQDQPQEADEAAMLQRQLTQLDRKLETARENFLMAGKSVAAGLLAKIETMETERATLADKLKGVQAQGRGNSVKEWWRNYQAEFLSEIWLDTPHHGKGRNDGPGTLPALLPRTARVVLDVPPTVLRERLLKLNLKVFVWFERKPKGMGWNLSKVRMTANVGKDLVFDYSSNPSTDESTNAAS